METETNQAPTMPTNENEVDAYFQAIATYALPENMRDSAVGLMCCRYQIEKQSGADLLDACTVAFDKMAQVFVRANKRNT